MKWRGHDQDVPGMASELAQQAHVRFSPADSMQEGKISWKHREGSGSQIKAKYMVTESQSASTVGTAVRRAHRPANYVEVRTGD